MSTLVFDRPSVADIAALTSRPKLTAREVEVLLAWFRSDSKPAVARTLFLSLGTVNTHLTRIRQKYAAVGRPAPTKASLVARALQDDIVRLTDL
ncbi:LuxR C-terminal-related transcriptional regulator [Rhodococcus sp. NPDC003994]|uniref:LuxR C-terminal-related transcriptional regulator n=1 Tax=Rhodococcoides kroppenstedtii TaxID=293050 RepID=UPI0035304F74